MAAITPSLGTGVSNGGYSVAEFWQAVANQYASLHWAAGTTWDATSDVLTITGATAYSHFVDPVTGDLRDIRKQELRQLPRPAGKRYMTAALTPSTVVALTLSDTAVGRPATGDGLGAGPAALFGVLGESF
jgi:hypothetical protein